MDQQPHAGLSNESLFALWRRGPSIPEVAHKLGKSVSATRMTIFRMEKGEKVEAERDVLAVLRDLYDNPPQRTLKESEEW